MRIRTTHNAKTIPHIDIGGVDVIRIGNARDLLEHDPIIVIGNAFLVLILLQVVASIRMLARVRLHLDGRLKLELVEHWELATLLAQLDE